MKKRLISVVLVLVMALSMTTTVFAADNWESDIDTVGAASVNGVYYHSLQDALANANGGVVKLEEKPNGTINTNGAALSLDLNGFSADVNCGELTLTDSGTDDGTEGGKVYGEFTVTEKVIEKDGVTYVLLPGEDEGGKYYTANAVRVVLKKVSIRPSAAGMYFTTELKFNKNVVGAGATYGVVLSTHSEIGKDFMSEKNDDNKLVNRWTVGKPDAGEDFNDNGNSCLVKNILSEDANATVNATRGATDIYAHGYVKIGDIVIMAENNGTVKQSLKSVMQTFDGKVGANDLNEATVNKLVDFYKPWKAAMDEWKLTNIASAYAVKYPAA